MQPLKKELESLLGVLSHEHNALRSCQHSIYLPAGKQIGVLLETSLHITLFVMRISYLGGRKILNGYAACSRLSCTFHVRASRAMDSIAAVMMLINPTFQP